MGELLGSLELDTRYQVVSWEERASGDAQAIVIHAGSGRELAAVGTFCEETASPLIELPTGSAVEGGEFAFPVVRCPNTNILMLKFKAMLEASGPLFRGYKIELTESHQALKTSVPGTAECMAHALGLAPEAIRSVRASRRCSTTRCTSPRTSSPAMPSTVSASAGEPGLSGKGVHYKGLVVIAPCR